MRCVIRSFFGIGKPVQVFIVCAVITDHNIDIALCVNVGVVSIRTLKDNVEIATGVAG